MQPIFIWTVHKALESWKSELLDTPSGPIGRRLRWHQLFSKFDLSVCLIPGKENITAYILSGWAYPASQGYREIIKHGTLEEKLEMEEMIRLEKFEEAESLEIRQAQPPIAGEACSGGESTVSFNVCPLKSRATRPKSKVPLQPQPLEPRGQMHHEVGGLEGPFSPKAGIEHLSHPAEVEEENFDDVASSDGDSIDEFGNKKVAPSGFSFRLESHELSQNEPSSSDPVLCKQETNAQFLSQPDWDNFYKVCPRWSSVWVATRDASSAWPKGIQIHNGRLFLNEKLCIPTSLESLWLREHHAVVGHVGSAKFWDVSKFRFEWGSLATAEKSAREVTMQCHACQACNRPQNMKAPLIHFPIPPRIMASVAMDVFHMPNTK